MLVVDRDLLQVELIFGDCSRDTISRVKMLFHTIRINIPKKSL